MSAPTVQLAGISAPALNAKRVMVLATALLFAILFIRPLTALALDIWREPDAGHGLLAVPLAVLLAWRAGRARDASPNELWGALALGFAVMIRVLSGLAAEQYTMRIAALLAGAALVIYHFGFGQLRHWWLPCALLWLAVPPPALVVGAVALPLQLFASDLGATLLDARHIPVMLAGNVIRLPGHELFVAEACSGLRSLTALLSLSVLVAGALKYPATRMLLVALAIPIAVVINAVRVFFTGFAVYYFGRDAGTGFLHSTEGWLMFVAALILLAGVAWLLHLLERRAAGGGR